MILDLVPRHNKASGTEKFYEIERLFKNTDDHDVTWMKCTWLNRSDDWQTTHLLLCECDFTENVGWYIGADKCFYEKPNRARICSYRQLAIQQRYHELRVLCGLDDNPSAEETEHAMRMLIAIASENRMIGDEYESSYFSLQTFKDITQVSIEQALEAADQVYQTKTACFDGRDLVSYQEPMWLVCSTETVTTKIASNIPGEKLRATVTLYKPLHGHMPPKWRYELNYSDGTAPVVDTEHYIRALMNFGPSLIQDDAETKLKNMRSGVEISQQKVDDLNSISYD